MKKRFSVALIVSFVFLVSCATIQQFPERAKDESFNCWYMRGLIQTSGKDAKSGDDTGKSIMANDFSLPCIRVNAYKDCTEIMKTDDGKNRFSSFESCTRYFTGSKE